MRKGIRWAAASVALLAALPATAQTVLDGNTIRYNGVTMRLWGVNAPEKGQICSDGWPAGQMAEVYLAGLVKDRKVNCDRKNTAEPKDAARPAAVFAVCKVDGQDLSAEMASQGLAWAYLPQTDAYSVPESNAMIAVVGVHAHDCDKAWEWRARHVRPPS